MSNIEKISIALTSEMAGAVREAVASGAYASNSEVVREALREWQMRHAEIAEIRRLWDEGINSGPAKSFSMEDFKKKVRRRLKDKKGR